MTKKSVLVTGSNGFIGSNLIMSLIKRGYYVLGIDDSYLFDENWERILTKNLASLDFSAVFHVGACSDTLETDVNYMMVRNFESTKVIADWCKKIGKPLIYSSSAANYGVNNKYPSNLYGWSKYSAECYVCAMGGIGLRYFNVYGPGEEHKGRMASVALQMYRKHQKGIHVSIFPKKPLRDFVYIKDVVSANIFAYLSFESLRGKYYEVGFGSPRSFEDVLQNIGINDFSYTSEESIPEGYQFLTCSDRRLWMEGWTPNWDLEAGMKDYREYLESDDDSRSCL